MCPQWWRAARELRVYLCSRHHLTHVVALFRVVLDSGTDSQGGYLLWW